MPRTSSKPQTSRPAKGNKPGTGPRIQKLSPVMPPEGAALPTDETTASPHDSQAMPPTASAPIRERRVVKLSDLKPNKVNGTIFSTSLSKEGLAELAQDIKLHGVRQAIEVTPELIVLDGERRWRGAKLAGLTEVEVIIVEGHKTRDEVGSFILDAFASTRNATVEEKVRLYDLATDILRNRHGRSSGRPKKGAEERQDYWTPDQIAHEAARKSGFGSVTIANYAVRIFEEGTAELRQQVNAGTMTITAAHSKLPRPQHQRGRAKKTVPCLEESGTPLEVPSTVPPAEAAGALQPTGETLESATGLGEPDGPQEGGQSPGPESPGAPAPSAVTVEEADPQELARDIRTAAENMVDVLKVLQAKDAVLAATVVGEIRVMLSQVGSAQAA